MSVIFPLCSFSVSVLLAMVREAEEFSRAGSPVQKRMGVAKQVPQPIYFIYLFNTPDGSKQ